MNSSEKLTALIDAHNELKRNFEIQGRQILKEVFKEFFENDWINGVKWNQYTPYFNDGEPCVFSVNDPVAGFVRDWSNVSSWGELDDGEEGDWVYDGWTSAREKLGPEKQEQIEQIDQFFDLFRKVPDDIFLSLFGDHCTVLATKDGFEVEEYEHD